MSVLKSITDEYKRYKALAEAAIGQLPDEDLARLGPAGGNSIDMLIRHVAGNLKSRFSDFRTSDGEKPWRRRDDEFEAASWSRAELMSFWEESWAIVLDEVGKLRDTDLGETVTVRRQPLRIDEALHRSLAHTAYHVGQIVYLAKEMRGESWRTLSIAKGKSEEYNQKAVRETATAHTEMLNQRRP
jgi:hypothetical protein